MTPDHTHRLEIDWVKTVAGALAAVSSAVLLSTLGAAGTIIGAALGSVVITVGSALYSQGLARSRHRLAHAQTAALRKVGIAQAEVRRAGRRQGDQAAVEGHLEHAEQRLGQARHDLDAAVQEPPALGLRRGLALLPWKHIALVAGGLFVAAVLAITSFELLAGRSVASYTGGNDGGGTSITDVTGGGGSEPAPSPTPTETPSEEPSPSDETTSPTDEPTPTPGESPSESESVTPSPTPSPTPGTPTTPTTEVPLLPSESSAQ
jgi:hypothetical protein